MSTSPTERSRRTPATRAGVLLLLATGLGAAGLAFLTGHSGRPAGKPALRRPGPADAVSAGAPAARESLATQPLPFEPPEESARHAPESFEDFRAHFVELAARDPLALEPLAEELFARAAPENETLAFLAVLRASGSPASVPWHEQAVRSGRTRADGHGAGLAEAALTSLRDDAAFDGAARAALARLAFEEPELAAGLRRRAAAAYAAHADDSELARLELALARETDATLVEGCLVALTERPPDFARTRLLALQGRSAAAADPADE